MKAKRGTREHAAAKLAQAETMMERRLRDLGRTLTSVKLWQRRCHYYAARVAMTDEQFAEERERRITRAQARAKKRRAINLKGAIV